MELLFAKRLKENRLKQGLTQEQLADRIGISYQSVSKWERSGGLPDITILPRLAACFGITVDELIGCDEQTREEDVRSFFKRYWAIPSPEGDGQRLALAKEYYRKYPRDYSVMWILEDAILQCPEDYEKNEDLMLELHEKIMSGCTEEDYRRDSLRRVCMIAGDAALEERIAKSGVRWENALEIGELREERFLTQRRWDEYRGERDATDLLAFMHYIGRNGYDYYSAENEYPFGEPARTVAWEIHVMRLLAAFDPSGIVPDGWSGWYAQSAIKASGALTASGKTDEGFALLEEALDLCERWISFPDGALLPLGCAEAFGGATVTKMDEKKMVHICFPDGRRVWSPYLWLFWMSKKEPYHQLTHWCWFDGVRDDARYVKVLEKAKRMAE